MTTPRGDKSRYVIPNRAVVHYAGPSSTIVVTGASLHSLRDISCTLRRGCLNAIVGPSGSGKSSLLRTIAIASEERFLRFLFGPSGGSARAKAEVRGLSITIPVPGMSRWRSGSDTAADLAELFNPLAQLYASAGIRHCARCDAPLPDAGFAAAVECVGGLGADGIVYLWADGCRLDRPTVERLQRLGLSRLRIDGAQVRLEEVIDEERDVLPSVELFIDAIPLGQAATSGRLLEALSLAAAVAPKIILEHRLAIGAEVKSARDFSLRPLCLECGEENGQLLRRHFDPRRVSGRCGRCQGEGRIWSYELPLFLGRSHRPLSKGGIRAWADPRFRPQEDCLKACCESAGCSPDTALAQLSPAQLQMLCFGAVGLNQLECEAATSSAFSVAGVLSKLAGSSVALRTRIYSTFATPRRCPDCEGSRIGRQAGATTVQGVSFRSLLSGQFDAIDPFVSSVSDSPGAPFWSYLETVRERARAVCRLGLGYLELYRHAETLSHGETNKLTLGRFLSPQRARSVLLVDEPTSGLHPRDAAQLLDSLEILTGDGNTIIAVTHDPQCAARAAHLVALGPGGGANGGTVVYEGCPESEWCDGSRRRAKRSPLPVPDRGCVVIEGMDRFHLKDLTVSFRIGAVTGIAGVSGAGKSTLLHHSLVPVFQYLSRRGALGSNAPARWEASSAERHLFGVSAVVGASRIYSVHAESRRVVGRVLMKATVGTASGVTAQLRPIFAALPVSRLRGLLPADFSWFSKRGWCPACRGTGSAAGYLGSSEPPVCGECAGSRLSASTRDIRLRGRTLAEILSGTVENEATSLSWHARLSRRLLTMNRLGLGYLSLNQPLSTLSQGERQKLRLLPLLDQPPSLEVTDQRSRLICFDEPAIGLSPAEVLTLSQLLTELAAAGHAVVCAEHNPVLLNCCDEILELGPGGGPEGGTLVSAGTPEALAADDHSAIGPYLRQDVPERAR